MSQTHNYNYVFLIILCSIGYMTHLHCAVFICAFTQNLSRRDHYLQSFICFIGYIEDVNIIWGGLNVGISLDFQLVNLFY